MYSYYECDDLGPANWYKINSICNGARQSPIDLPASAVLRTKPLCIKNFEVKPDSNNIKNDGHGAQIVFNYRHNDKCLLSGGSLKYKYEVAKAHWHWGQFNYAGSEHSLNGHQYSAELHIVAFASKYGSLSNAVDKSDGLAVLAFFYELDNRNEERSDFIIKKDLGLIVKSNTNDYIRIQNSFSLKDLIKYQRFHYFSYQGSLTTPPCYESVTWIVANTPLKIKTEDLDELRNLKDNEGRCILKNCRPIQHSHQSRQITDYRQY
ncbi:CLUMA_CG005097, isoform A [Clunio marinus]|uniref:Carbonic anhydrase n=1 Tax=Clunio marinus TaxID=568069 RepID=A0A1J1HZ75_9DIPT|nr:CLUMA_CG005097, isoform A [Clunio marinus]